MKKRTIPNEHKLIFLCARSEINNSTHQEIIKILNDSINWNKIIEISNRHQILPFLYYNIKKLDLQNIIPPGIFWEMKNCYYANLNKNIILEKEISLVLQSTNREGIDIIPFRGFDLMQTLYHNPALRIMADIDILIKQNQFLGIKRILTRLNYYESPEKNTSEEYYRKDQQISVFSKTYAPNQFLAIEIHRAIAPPRPYKINLPHLWQRIQEKTINTQKLLSLSLEDTFLSLVLHLRRHTRRLTLKFIVDIVKLLNTNANKFDWVYIKKSAKNNHIVTPVYLSLYLVKELLKVNVSPKILNRFQPNIIKSILIYLTLNEYNFFIPEKWQGIFLRLLLFDSPIDFLFYLWRVSFLERFLTRRGVDKF